MTIWDKIYKNFQNGGQAWATLEEGIIKPFLDFVNDNTFVEKSALDIGCGTGNYLAYLKSKGFTTTGIDSSETSVEMTRKILGDESSITCIDMYKYEVPTNKFDLVISLSTIHHGTKDKITNLINKIYSALLPDGKVFITLPTMESGSRWNTFKTSKEIAPGTYSPLSGPEEGLPHSFFTEDEVRQIFCDFKDLKVSVDEIGRFLITAKK